MVTEANLAAAEVGALQKRHPPPSDMSRRLTALQQQMLTPPVRYSQPALQSHIQYLYSAMNSADQKVSRDAQLRYAELRRQLDRAVRELHSLIQLDSGT
jgi:hypothetical protein